MTVSGIGIQTSNLQTITALSAFQRNIKKNDEIKKDTTPEINDEDVKTFISSRNIQDIADEDIKYAMKYGTSLFVDQMA